MYIKFTHNKVMIKISKKGDDFLNEECYNTSSDHKGGRAKKIVALILTALFLMIGTSFATVMIYSAMATEANENSIVNQNNGSGNNSSVIVPVSNDTNALTGTQIVEKVKPSVVGILTETKTSGNNFLNPFGKGFGSSNVSTSTGTGIIYSEDGYIITNAHVVSGATSIKVYLYDDTEYTATLCGLDETEDLAVLKINATGLTPAELGDSDALQEGETVYAMGNPMGLEYSGSITMGLVSSIDREVTVENSTMTLIQHSASISPGNSGGPLINCYGQVVGINSVKIVSTGAEGIGFAIPIKSSLETIENLKQGIVSDSSGEPLIGITGMEITESMSRQYNVPRGVYVSAVDSSKGAYSAGVESGDIIVGINGTAIETMNELNEVKNQFKAGETVTLTIYRSGFTGDLEVVLS